MNKRIPSVLIKACLFLLTVMFLWGSGLLQAAETILFPTKETPIVVDKTAARVLIYAEVNPNGLKKANPHWGVVYQGGTLKDKGILIAYCSPSDFHQALIEIEAKPGDNLTPNTMGEYVKGSPLKVTAVLPGLNKEFSLEQLIDDSSGKGFQIRFGGNRDRAIKEKIGCITCLESCWIGITSNAAYPAISSVKRLISPNSRFKGKPNELPNREGKPVILIYRLEQN